jgi:hypothetical protein
MLEELQFRAEGSTFVGRGAGRSTGGGVQGRPVCGRRCFGDDDAAAICACWGSRCCCGEDEGGEEERDGCWEEHGERWVGWAGEEVS